MDQMTFNNSTETKGNNIADMDLSALAQLRSSLSSQLQSVREQYEAVNEQFRTKRRAMQVALNDSRPRRKPRNGGPDTTNTAE